MPDVQQVVTPAPKPAGGSSAPSHGGTSSTKRDLRGMNYDDGSRALRPPPEPKGTFAKGDRPATLPDAPPPEGSPFDPPPGQKKLPPGPDWRTPSPVDDASPDGDRPALVDLPVDDPDADRPALNPGEPAPEGSPFDPPGRQKKMPAGPDWRTPPPTEDLSSDGDRDATLPEEGAKTRKDLRLKLERDVADGHERVKASEKKIEALKNEVDRVDIDLDNAVDGDIKLGELRAKKAELQKSIAAEEKAIETANGEIVSAKKNIEVVKSPGSGPDQLGPLYAKYGSKYVQGSGDTTVYGGNPGTGGRTVTSTRTVLDKGQATVTTDERKDRIGLGGVETSKSTSTTTSQDGGTKTVSSSEGQKLGWKGFKSTSESSESKTDDKGKTTGAKNSQVDTVGLSGFTRDTTDEKSHADGSKDNKSSQFKMSGGQISYDQTNTHTNADESTRKQTSSISASRVDDENGKGVAAKGSVGVEDKKPTKDPNGTSSGSRTLGAKATCNNKVQVRVVTIPAKDGEEPKAKVITTINFGVSLGGNASQEKERGGTSGSLGVTASASGNITATFTDIIPQKDATNFLAGINPGDPTGEGLIGRAANIVGIATASDWVTAAKTFMNFEHNSPKGVKELPEGAGMGFEVAGDIEGGAKVGVDSGIFGANVAGGRKAGTSFKYNVVKLPGGKARVTVVISNTESANVGGGVKAGVVSLDVKNTEKSGDSSMIQFELDTSAGDFDKLFEELKACKTTAALNAFAAAHKPLVKARSHDTDSASEDEVKASVLGEDGLNITGTSGAGVTTTTTIDDEGNLEINKTGFNKRGVEVGVGALGLSYKSSEREQAQATKVDNESALDVSQKNESSNMTNQIANQVDKKLGGSGTEYKEQDVSVAGMMLTRKDLTHLIDLACSDDANAWGNHTGNPDVYKDWMKVRDELRAKFKDKKAKPNEANEAADLDADAHEAANILASFVGKKEGIEVNVPLLGRHRIGGADSGRDDVIYATVRNAGEADGGRRYEFPDELASFKDEYDAIAIGNPLKDLAAKLNQKEPMSDEDKAQETKFAQGIAEHCRSLYQSLNSAGANLDKFKHGGDLPEMLAAIERRQGEAEVLISRLGGKSGDDIEMEKATNRYNTALGACTTCREQADGIFAKMADNIGDDNHLSTGDAEEHRKQLAELTAVYAQWRKNYTEVLNVRAEFGIGNPHMIAERKPDDARFQAASKFSNPNTPELLSAAAAERADALQRMERTPVARGVKKKAEPSYVQSYDPVAEQKAHDQKHKQQAEGYGAALPSAQAACEARRNMLQCWLFDHRIPDAAERYDTGVRTMNRAKTYAAKVKPGNLSTLETDAAIAIQDFQAAQSYFQEGLNHYPGKGSYFPKPKAKT